MKEQINCISRIYGYLTTDETKEGAMGIA